RLGDEDAETEPADLALAARRMAADRQIRLADAVEDLRREARSVVGDRDRHLAVAPLRRNLDLRAREVDGVFHEIAEPVNDRRVVLADRLGRAILRHRPLDPDPERALRGPPHLDRGREPGT